MAATYTTPSRKPNHTVSVSSSSPKASAGGYTRPPNGRGSNVTKARA